MKKGIKIMNRQQAIEEICKVTTLTIKNLEYEDIRILEDLYIIHCQNGDQNQRVKVIQ